MHSEIKAMPQHCAWCNHCDNHIVKFCSFKNALNKYIQKLLGEIQSCFKYSVRQMAGTIFPQNVTNHKFIIQSNLNYTNSVGLG